MDAHFPACEKHAHLTTDECPLCTEDTLRARVAEPEAALCWVRNELCSSSSPDTPDHDHENRGIWDETGEPCEECARWNKVWALVSHIEP